MEGWKGEEVAENNLPPLGMTLIPAGEFEMGDRFAGANENKCPAHTVYLDAFYMDQYPVTIERYREFLNATDYRKPDWDKVAGYFPIKELSPMICVSWHDAMAYAKWAGTRLPTEAEWEKAARGGLTGKKYPWGNSIDETKANYNNNVWNGRVKGEGRHGTTTPVGSYPPNGYGLYDMAGNVWEWCLDEYQEQFYLGSPERNPIAGGKSVTELVETYEHVRTVRVLRGGSWGIALYNNFVELAARFNFYPTYPNVYTGFRCVRPLQ